MKGEKTMIRMSLGLCALVASAALTTSALAQSPPPAPTIMSYKFNLPIVAITDNMESFAELDRKAAEYQKRRAKCPADDVTVGGIKQPREYDPTNSVRRSGNGFGVRAKHCF